MLKIEQQADLSAKRESLKKLSLLCHSISGLPNVYTIFIYRKRTPFSEKRPYYWLGYGLRWLCGTTIRFVMRVYDYIPLMSPVRTGDTRKEHNMPTAKKLPSGNWRTRVFYTDADGKERCESFTAETKKNPSSWRRSSLHAARRKPTAN